MNYESIGKLKVALDEFLGIKGRMTNATCDNGVTKIDISYYSPTDVKMMCLVAISDKHKDWWLGSMSPADIMTTFNEAMEKERGLKKRREEESDDQ